MLSRCSASFRSLRLSRGGQVTLLPDPCYIYMSRPPRTTLTTQAHQQARVGVTGVLFHPLDGRSVLMVQRGRPPFVGSWALPGGSLLYGETLAAGCARELSEECGIHVDVGQVVAVTEIILKHEPNLYHYLLQHMACTCSPSAAVSIRAGDDAMNVAWIDVSLIQQQATAPPQSHSQSQSQSQSHPPTHTNTDTNTETPTPTATQRKAPSMLAWASAPSQSSKPSSSSSSSSSSPLWILPSVWPVVSRAQLLLQHPATSQLFAPSTATSAQDKLNSTRAAAASQHTS